MAWGAGHHRKQILRAVQAGIIIEAGMLLFFTGVFYKESRERAVTVTADVAEEKKFIKWVDFNVTSEAMHLALEYDLETHDTDTPIDWVTLLAYAGTRGGGSFNQQSLKYIYAAAQSIMNGEETIESLTADMEYYPYYLEAYEAVLGGYVGEYRMEDAASEACSAADQTADGELLYGVKVFSPIAKGFGYSDYDDFGTSRSYGYSRPHL